MGASSMVCRLFMKASWSRMMAYCVVVTPDCFVPLMINMPYGSWMMFFIVSRCRACRPSWPSLMPLAVPRIRSRSRSPAVEPEVITSM
jgi:hypothetical protein